MELELLMEQTGEFRGNYPDIPLPADIDLEALKGMTFVTLPIGAVNARSRGSKRRYTRRACEKVVACVNEMRPEGGWGHVKGENIATEYNPPAVRWLAATLDEETGIVWGKALALSEQAEKHFRVAKATNARVGTSLWGPPPTLEGSDVVDLTVLRIDIADPTRVGIEAAAAHPHLTSEMEGRRMGELGDMIAARDQALGQVAEMQGQVAARDAQLAEMQPTLAAAAKAEAYLAEMADSYVNMGINISASGTDFADVLRQLTEKLRAMQAAELAGSVTEMVTEMVKAAALRDLVSEMLIGEDGLPRVASADEAKAKIEAFLAKPSTQRLAQSLLNEQAGPGAVVTAATSGATGDQWRDEMASKAGELAKARGVRVS